MHAGCESDFSGRSQTRSGFDRRGGALAWGGENPIDTAARAVGSNEFDSVHDEHAEARRLLIALGLSEAQGQTLISSQTAKLVTDAAMALQNPLSSDMKLLRPSLIPGLLDTLRHNLNRKNNDVAVFEIGRVFRLENGTPREQRNVAIALTGLRQSGLLDWRGTGSNVRRI